MQIEYIATFFTHSGAVKYQRYMQREKINIELQPVPRQVSSNCGIGARFTFNGDIKQYISEDTEKLSQVTADGYKLLYEND